MSDFFTLTDDGTCAVSDRFNDEHGQTDVGRLLREVADNGTPNDIYGALNLIHATVHDNPAMSSFIVPPAGSTVTATLTVDNDDAVARFSGSGVYALAAARALVVAADSLARTALTAFAEGDPTLLGNDPNQPVLHVSVDDVDGVTVHEL